MKSYPEIEASVVGMLLTYAHIEEDAPVKLTDEFFTDMRYRTIYGIVHQLSAEGRSSDVFVVSAELQRTGRLENPIGLLMQLSQQSCSRTRFADHVLLLHQAWMERRMAEIAADLTNPGERNAQDVMEQAQNALFSLGESALLREATPIADDILEAQQRIAAASAEGLPYTGIISGFHQLDKLTLGFQPTDLIILAARPSQGKTALAVSLTRNIAQHTSVAFFSLEMGRQQIANRLIMQASGLAGEKVRKGVLSADEQTALLPALDQLKSLPIYLDDTPSLSVQQLRLKARKLVRRQGVKLIVVDYLQLMTAGVAKNATRENEVSAISRALKCIAKELNVPILALAQLNREMERGAEGREPRLSDLRESGAIEQDADIVMMLHKPRTSLDATERELILAKHRNGATGHVLLHFQASTAEFRG